MKLNHPIEAELRGGEKREYLIRAKAGQLIHAVVNQKGIDVAVTLFDPAGKQLTQTDTLNGLFGPEPISAIAESSGDFRLEAASGDNNAAAGKIEVRLAVLHAPTQQDRVHMTAERTYMEGEELYVKADNASLAEAVSKWKQSLNLWQSVADRYEEALVATDIGEVCYRLGEKQQALDYLNQALPLQRILADRSGEAETLAAIGSLYGEMNKRHEALDYLKQALKIQLDLGNRHDAGVTLIKIGSSLSNLGENQKALESYLQALDLERAVADRWDEALTLRNIGMSYDGFGQYLKALDYLNQSLSLWKTLGDKTLESQTLADFGSVYSNLGENQKALDYYTQALPLLRASAGGYGPYGVASTLTRRGLIYSHLGDGEKALKDLNEALLVWRQMGDGHGEGIALSYIGEVYDGRGEYPKALEYCSQALAIEHSLGERQGEAGDLDEIGELYDALGEYQRALENYNQALPLRRATGDRRGEAQTLRSIGKAYFDLGDYPKALEYYNQALPLWREVGDRGGEAITLNNIGKAYADLGDNQEALDYYNQALPLHRAVENRSGEANTLTNIGMVCDVLGNKQQALEYYSQALPLARAAADRWSEAKTMLRLMNYWKENQRPALAIFFGKEAIDLYQQVRRNIAGLDRETQQSFVKSKENSYRELAELLISEGRLPEAQQILDTLKVEEYSEFTQRRGGDESPGQPVAKTPAEKKSEDEENNIESEITSLGREWSDLHGIKERTQSEEARYSEISGQLAAANQRLQEYLVKLYADFGKGAAANARLEQIQEGTSGLQNLAQELGPGTVALYTLVLDDKCVVLVITPATRVVREVRVGKVALRTKVFALATAMASHQPDENIQAKARDVYDVLVAPIEKDLRGAGAQTLVWSLDDVLRYVPVAALYDGKQFLVETYRNAVITTASIGNLKDSPQVRSWQGLAMGISKDYGGMGELKEVPDELNSVVHSDAMKESHGPVPGTILLNDTFTEKSMTSSLERHPPLVHIASHYRFVPGDDTKSYLLLGGKDAGGEGFRLTLADMRVDPRVDLSGIELLTLSACQTAVGSNDSDGREVDGLGIVAQQKGAKAVMATLWPVDDASVGKLMATFYKTWIATPGMTKAEALRQAQLALLHSAKSGGGNSAQENYANPFYWAPFILIGNWK